MLIPYIVRSRAKRILSRLKGYRDAVVDDAIRFGVALDIASKEALIGVYTNPPGAAITAIAVMSDGLVLLYANQLTQRLYYSSIEAITWAKDGPASRTMNIIRHDGTVCEMEIAGGEGRFRDSTEFIRFLDRVVADTRGAGQK